MSSTTAVMSTMISSAVTTLNSALSTAAPTAAPTTAAPTTTAAPATLVLAANQTFWDPSDPFSINWVILGQTILTSIVGFIGKLLVALLLLVIGWIVISIVMWIVATVMRRSHQSFDSPVIRFIVNAVGIFLKIMLVVSCIDLLGVQVLSFSAFFAAFGLGIGASISGAMHNFFAGLMLIVQKAHVVGDWIAIDGSVEGEVMRIGVTHSTLKTPQNLHITVPNQSLVSGPITNYNKELQLRCDVEVFIRHSEDVDFVRNLFYEVCASLEPVLALPKPVMRVTDVTANGLKLSLRVWTNTADYWPLFSQMREELKRNFERNNVQFQIDRIEVETTPATDPTRYRTGQPTMEELARLEKLSEMWDVMADAIVVVKKKAQDHHNRSIVRKPLKLLRRKFAAQAADSSEEASEKVDRVLNFSRTALRTAAENSMKMKDEVQGRHSSRRRAKKIVSAPEVQVTTAASVSDEPAAGADEDDGITTPAGRRGNMLSTISVDDWDLEQLHRMLTSSKGVSPDADVVLVKKKKKDEPTNLSALEPMRSAREPSAAGRSESASGAAPISVPTAPVESSRSESARAASVASVPAATAATPTLLAVPVDPNKPIKVEKKAAAQEVAAAKPAKLEKAQSVKDETLASLAPVMGKEMAELRERGEKGQQDSDDDNDEEASQK